MEKQTLAERTAERLIAMIRARSYEPGDRLPTEQELMEQLTVGRNTLREALRFLVSRNMVVIRQGAGTFVSEKQGVADDPLGFTFIDDKRRLAHGICLLRGLFWNRRLRRWPHRMQRRRTYSVWRRCFFSWRHA